MKYILLLFISSLTTVSCQNHGRLNIIHSLPNSLEEISGITMTRDSLIIWAVNDSGNDAVVFGYDPNTNSVERSIRITNGTNVDWEDLTSDGENVLFIGDFGNNRNNRKDLVIYTVSVPDSLKYFKIYALKTTFTLEDQTEFPPKKKNRNFDIEAFVYADEFFYLFTRNRSSGFDGTTKMYRLPAKPGHYTAELMDSFKTCNDPDDCQVTGAALDRSGKKLALLGYNKVWIFSDYENDEFFSANVKEIKLKHRSQKESITFKNGNTLYIADELNGAEGGNLYSLTIDQ